MFAECWCSARSRVSGSAGDSQMHVRQVWAIPHVVDYEQYNSVTELFGYQYYFAGFDTIWHSTLL